MLHFRDTATCAASSSCSDTHTCMHIRVYVDVYIHVYMYTYIYIYRESNRGILMTHLQLTNCRVILLFCCGEAQLSLASAAYICIYVYTYIDMYIHILYVVIYIYKFYVLWITSDSLKSQVCVCIGEAQHSEAYGVALVSRIDKL